MAHSSRAISHQLDKHQPFFRLLALILVCAKLSSFGEIAVLNFSKDQLPQNLGATENVIAGIKWQDKYGLHVVIECEKTNGTRCEPGYSSEIHAYMFTIGKGMPVKDWEIRDFGENECSTASFLEGTLKVDDIEANGEGEPSFCYQIGHDCCDPVTVKFILHIGKTKLAIRGKIPMIADDSASYEKQFDKAFKGIPEGYRNFASKEWDRCLDIHFDFFKSRNPIEKSLINMPATPK
jgi:hypothetical protein